MVFNQQRCVSVFFVVIVFSDFAAADAAWAKFFALAVMKLRLAFKKSFFLEYSAVGVTLRHTRTSNEITRIEPVVKI